MTTLRIRTILALLCVSVLLVACGDDPAGPSGGVAGTYTLRSVDGDAIPLVFFEGATERLEVLSGTITLTADGRYNETIRFRTTNLTTGQAQTTNAPDAGSYSLQGSDVTFVSDVPAIGTYPGRISGLTLTYTYGQIAWEFRR